MQASEILIALTIVQIERRALTLVPGTLGLAHHHIGLGTAAGTNLQAATGRVAVAISWALRSEATAAARSNTPEATVTWASTGAWQPGKTGATSCEDIRIGLGRKGVLMQCKRRRRQIASKVEAHLRAYRTKP